MALWGITDADELNQSAPTAQRKKYSQIIVDG